MWGCLKGLAFTFGALFIILIIIFGGGWWYLGTSSFNGLVRLRIQKTLEARLGRSVVVGSVQIQRGNLGRIVINEKGGYTLVGVGALTTPTLRGTAQVAPPYTGGDCVTKPVTAATFLAQVTLYRGVEPGV